MTVMNRDDDEQRRTTHMSRYINDCEDINEIKRDAQLTAQLVNIVNGDTDILSKFKNNKKEMRGLRK
ncbi:hypothetical protein Scep_007833 [Stephania cephalantha]|uniref:Uncharacterized protein n=1 Tax=Stephania cephalantha TaxID=152367 RepID=A0AAP0KAL1_9MAGN